MGRTINPSFGTKMGKITGFSTAAIEDTLDIPEPNEEARSIIDSIKYSSSLPSVVYLYDDVGSALFEDITKTKEYYVTNTEHKIIADNAHLMARFNDEEEGSTRDFRSSLVELGAGSGKKMRPLIKSLAQIPKTQSAKCMYNPADYSASALEENVNVYNLQENVEPFVGTHEEALSELSTRPGRKTYAYLGSSLGNELDPIPFLKNLSANCGARDRVLLGLDMAASNKKPVSIIHDAYNDSEGVTERFILNSLSVVNRVAGLDFDQNNFCLRAEYNHEKDAVEIFAECTKACELTASDGEEFVRSFVPGDRIFIEQSGKFSEEKISKMTQEAGFMEVRRWSDDKGYFSILELVPDVAGNATKLSDFVFKDLIGVDRLSEQPLELRNPFAFYWGHIPAFSDRRALGLEGRDHEREVFERGVDPDVDDPTNCHRHSPRHQVWPSASEFEKYEREVEAGLRQKITKEGVSRDVLLSLEHAEMHHETLMYMILQSQTPSNVGPHPLSPFEGPPTTKRKVPKDHFVDIKATEVRLGASPEEIAGLGFVWDNEAPQKFASVGDFVCATSPITNNQFKEFVNDGGYRHAEFWNDNEINQQVLTSGGNGAWAWASQSNLSRPLFWTDDGVRTLLGGAVPFSKSGDWPAVVSLFEAAAYCKWRGNGARIMSEAEYHALFSSSDDFMASSKRGNNNWRYQGVVPVGHMEDANSKGISDLVGNGWEWTSTVFGGFEGFTPLYDYEEYSADFFDGKHFVLKGASPYTGSLVQRLSFRNWFQPNYPYPIAKFRLVY